MQDELREEELDVVADSEAFAAEMAAWSGSGLVPPHEQFLYFGQFIERVVETAGLSVDDEVDLAVLTARRLWLTHRAAALN